MRANVERASGSDQRHQVIIGIAIGGVGEFVSERLHGERVINVRDRTQPADANVRRGLSVFRTEVGNVERYDVPSHGHFARATVVGIRIKC